ncbi:MAG: zinc-ribbon domain-containing protein [Candidatus Methylomirabilis oxyfera]|nr:zinc-ribbon domain-containing protein [Candidatus Methylomirabilis oxyfera]
MRSPETHLATALRDCPECGKAVSTEADVCPQCGHPIICLSEGGGGQCSEPRRESA